MVSSAPACATRARLATHRDHVAGDEPAPLDRDGGCRAGLVRCDCSRGVGERQQPGAAALAGKSARGAEFPANCWWANRVVVASRPVRRILFGTLRSVGGHPSRPAIARRLQRPTRGRSGGTTLPLLGLAPDGVYRATRVTPDAGALLPHRFTLTCARRPSAVCSLLHFPAGHPDWALPSILPCGVRTVLGRITTPKSGSVRGHPADSPPPPFNHCFSAPSCVTGTTKPSCSKGPKLLR